MEIVRAPNCRISVLAAAVTVTEQNGLSGAMRHAYYAVMILGRNVWEQDDILTKSHRSKLLSGFHDLAFQCSSLPKQPAPNFTHSACNSPYVACGRSYSPSGNSSKNNGCKLGWLHLWKHLFRQPLVQDAFTSLSPADLGGRLLHIAKHLAMAPACMKSASIKIEAMSEEFLENTPNLFVDPR
jgi:hypothetical protein